MRLEKYALARIGDIVEDEVECDTELRFAEITPAFLEALEQLGPFGPGHAEPVFVSFGVRLTTAVKVVKERHLRLTVEDPEDGRRMGGMAWSRQTDWAALAREMGWAQGDALDLAYRLRRNWHPGVWRMGARSGGHARCLCSHRRMIALPFWPQNFCFEWLALGVLYTDILLMAQQETERTRRWVWAVLAVAACFALFFGLRLHHEEVPVRAAQVERRDIVSTVSTNGKVEPTEDFQAHAPMSGVVNKLFVDLGQKVQRGQELIRMDESDALKNVAVAQANLDSSVATLNAMEHGGTQDELLTAKSDLAQAQTQEKLDESSLAALQKLQTQGAASANEVASAQQRLSDAKAREAQLNARRNGRYAPGDLDAQRAQVTQARVALAAARNAYANVDIRAHLRRHGLRHSCRAV